MEEMRSGKVTTTAERLKEIMKNKGWKQVDIVNAAQPFCERYGIKLGRNDVSQYVSGKVEPNQRKLTILALALNVSEVWLMGYDQPVERDSELGSIRARLEEYYYLFNQLSPEEQNIVLLQLRGMTKGRKEKP